MPPVRRQVAPTRRTMPARPATGSLRDRIDQYAAQAPRQDEGGGVFDKDGPAGGLGWVIGKGLGGGLKALSVLDYPRSAVVAGIRQGLDTEVMEDFNRALAKLPGVDYSPISNPDYEAGWQWGEFWKDVKNHEGFGTSIVEPAMGAEQGTDRSRLMRIAAGFSGDVAADPLTYLGIGVGAQAGKAERASRLHKLAGVQDDIARQVAEQGDNVAAELLARQARLGGTRELERIGSRGLGTANREQLLAMGLDRNGLRWGGTQGLRIPGTETLGRGLSETLGALRPAARSVPGAGLLRQASTRKGYLGQDLLPSFERVITGQGRQTMREALDTIATNEMLRVAGGGFEGRANAALRVLSRKTRGQGDNEVSDAVHAAETGTDNMFSKFSDDMREAARQVGGEIPEFQPIQLGDGRVVRHAVPHILSRPFRDYLESGAGSQAVEDFKRAAGLTTDDLLEESGFLQKRIFRPNADGTPAQFKIGDQVLNVEEGTLRELDNKLRGMFPDYDGPIYETSPVEAWRRYIGGVKRDVAKRSAFREAAAKGFSHVEQLRDKPEAYDPFGGRETVMIGQGDDAVEAQRVVPNPEAEPTHPQYVMRPDAKLTKERNRAIGTAKRGDQADILASYETFSRAERGRIAGEIDQLAESLLKPIRERRADLLEREIVRQGKVTEAAQRVEMFDKLRPQVEQELNNLADEAQQVQRAIRNVQRTADARTKRQQERLLRGLQERWKQLSDENDRLTSAYEQALAAIDERAARAGENVVDLPTERQIREHPQKRIRQENERLLRNETQHRGARDRAKRDYIQRRRDKGSWVEKTEFDKAQAQIERAARSGELERYRRLVDDEANARRAAHRAYADASDLDEAAARIRTEIDQLRRESGRDVTDEMLRTAERLEGLEAQVDGLQAELDDALMRGDKEAAQRLRSTRDHVEHEAERLRTRMMRATPAEMSEQLQGLQADINRHFREGAALREQAENQLDHADRLRERINGHRLNKAADTVTKYNRAQEELGRATQAAEQAWQNAKRELDDFEQAIREEAQRGTAQVAPTSPLDEPRLAEYVRNEQRAVELERQLATANEARGATAEATQRQTAAIERRLNGTGSTLGEREELRRLEHQHAIYARGATHPPKQKPTPRQVRLAQARDAAAAEIAQRKQAITEAEKQIRTLRKGIQGPPRIAPREEIKLRRELKRLQTYLTKNTKLGEEVRQARQVGAQTTERPRRLPFFENLDREVAELRGQLDARERIPKVMRAQESLMRVPQIEAVRGELADVQRGLAGAQQEAADIALLEGREGMEQTRQLRDTGERIRMEQAEYRGALDRIDDQTGRARQTYQMAMNDLDRARAESQAVADSMKGINASPERASTMVETTKKEAKAAATRLELVSKGQMPSYAAQPMHRVLDDLDKLVAANPLGNDPAMRKAESVSHALRQQLSDLTDKVDLPARETRRIIKAANNGELAPVLTAQINDALKLLWDEGDIVIRRDAMKMYLNIRTGVQDRLFGRLLTTWTNFFKTYATLSPGFHVRNALTAIFMNFTEGVTSREQISALRLWREFRNSDEPIAWLAKLRETDPRAYDAFGATFASHPGGQFTEKGVGEMADVRGRIKEGLFANRLTKGSQRLGGWVEGPQRLALALHSTRNGGSAVDALQAVTRIHFDYSQVSDFDEKAKRIIPFWTFTSRNIPLQFTQMWMRPRTYNHYASFARNVGQTPLPEFTPEYMEQAGAINTGETTPGWLPGADAGMPILLQPDLPHLRLQEDVLRTTAPLRGENMGQALSDVNPIFTAPFEYMLGEDFYTGQRYDETDVSKTTNLGAPLAAVASVFGAGRRGANGEWYIDDKAMNLLNTLLPPLERQSRLVPGLLTSGEDQGKNDRLAESYARFWLGAPIRTLSEKQMQNEARRRFYEMADQQQRLAATGG